MRGRSLGRAVRALPRDDASWEGVAVMQARSLSSTRAHVPVDDVESTPRDRSPV